MGDDRIAAHRTVSVPLTGDSAISQSTSGSGGWFNDRRFNLAGPRQQLQQNINVVLREVNEAVADNPIVLAQIRQQLEVISDLIRTTNNTENANNVIVPPVTPLSDIAPSNTVIVNIEEDEDESVDGSSDNENDHADRTQPTDEEQPATADTTLVNGAGVDNASAAAAANLNAEMRRIRQLLRSPEIQRIIAMCMRILPFLLILFIKLLIDHVLALISIAISIVCLLFADSNLTRAIASGRSGSSTYMCALLKACITSLLWITMMIMWFDGGDDTLEYTMQLRLSPMTQSAELCSTIYAIVLGDFAAKICAIQFKVLVCLVPHACLSPKRRRRIYQWIEYTNQLYRYWLPAPQWFSYIRTAHATDSISTSIGFMMAVSYLALKLFCMQLTLKNWYNSGKYLCRLSAVGTVPSKSDLAGKDSNCAICYAPFSSPIKFWVHGIMDSFPTLAARHYHLFNRKYYNYLCFQLNCGHIYCEDCISTWLDKEHTCPMCRAKVMQEDNDWKCGSTTWLPQLF